MDDFCQNLIQNPEQVIWSDPFEFKVVPVENNLGIKIKHVESAREYFSIVKEVKPFAKIGPPNCLQIRDRLTKVNGQDICHLPLRQLMDLMTGGRVTFEARSFVRYNQTANSDTQKFVENNHEHPEPERDEELGREAVRNPDMIQWNPVTKKTVLIKNERGKLGFNYKVKSVDSGKMGTTVYCLVEIVKEPPAKGKLQVGDWIRSANDIPLQENKFEQLKSIIQSSGRTVSFVLQTPEKQLADASSVDASSVRSLDTASIGTSVTTSVNPSIRTNRSQSVEQLERRHRPWATGNNYQMSEITEASLNDLQINNNVPGSYTESFVSQSLCGSESFAPKEPDWGDFDAESERLDSVVSSNVSMRQSNQKSYTGARMSDPKPEGSQAEIPASSLCRSSSDRTKHKGDEELEAFHESGVEHLLKQAYASACKEKISQPPVIKVICLGESFVTSRMLRYLKESLVISDDENSGLFKKVDSHHYEKLNIPCDISELIVARQMATYLRRSRSIEELNNLVSQLLKSKERFKNIQIDFIGKFLQKGEDPQHHYFEVVMETIDVQELITAARYILAARHSILCYGFDIQEYISNPRKSMKEMLISLNMIKSYLGVGLKTIIMTFKDNKGIEIINDTFDSRFASKLKASFGDCLLRNANTAKPLFVVDENLQDSQDMESIQLADNLNTVILNSEEFCNESYPVIAAVLRQELLEWRERERGTAVVMTTKFKERVSQLDKNLTEEQFDSICLALIHSGLIVCDKFCILYNPENICESTRKLSAFFERKDFENLRSLTSRPEELVNAGIIPYRLVKDKLGIEIDVMEPFMRRAGVMLRKTADHQGRESTDYFISPFITKFSSDNLQTVGDVCSDSFSSLEGHSDPASILHGLKAHVSLPPSSDRYYVLYVDFHMFLSKILAVEILFKLSIHHSKGSLTVHAAEVASYISEKFEMVVDCNIPEAIITIKLRPRGMKNLCDIYSEIKKYFLEIVGEGPNVPSYHIGLKCKAKTCQPTVVALTLQGYHVLDLSGPRPLRCGAEIVETDERVSQWLPPSAQSDHTSASAPASLEHMSNNIGGQPVMFGYHPQLSYQNSPFPAQDPSLASPNSAAVPYSTNFKPLQPVTQPGSHEGSYTNDATPWQPNGTAPWQPNGIAPWQPNGNSLWQPNGSGPWQQNETLPWQSHEPVSKSGSVTKTTLIKSLNKHQMEHICNELSIGKALTDLIKIFDQKEYEEEIRGHSNPYLSSIIRWAQDSQATLEDFLFILERICQNHLRDDIIGWLEQEYSC